MKLFIGCGSSDDVPKYYFKDCEELLNKILKDNDLLYGAYNKGIMGLAYNISKKYNRYITGIAPKRYESDLEELEIDEKIVVNDIEQRTHELIVRSDAIVFLPGGIGTMNEIFSAIDSKRSDEFNKPIIFYNSNHYFDKLFVFLDQLYNEKYSPIEVKDTYFVTDNIDKVIEYLKESEM